MEMECARWEGEYRRRDRLGLRDIVSLHARYLFIGGGSNLSPAVATYFECTRSPAHSLLCPKLEKQLLLPPGATWRPSSRRPLLYGKVRPNAQDILGALSGNAQWLLDLQNRDRG